MYLAAGQTGRGHGRRLLSELLTRCTAAGYRQAIAVIVDGATDASVALHKALGFEEAGRLRGVGHKQDRWLDTLLLQREL